MQAKRVMFAVLLLLLGLAVGAAAAAAYYWQRATALPTWYSTGADSGLTTGVAAGGSLLQTKLASGAGVRYGSDNRVEISLSEAELTQLVAEGLAQTPETARFLEATEGINATIDGNRVTGGVVVNPANLPTQDLSPQGQRAVERALNTVPQLGDRALYIGIEGSPRVENGRLVLGDDTQVQIGRVRLSVDEVAQLTGLDPAQLTEKINLALPEAGLTLDGIEFVNGEAVLRGATP
ncbi:MAG: hypothetical protein ACFCVB_08385 [Nodosilinea sp.]